MIRKHRRRSFMAGGVATWAAVGLGFASPRAGAAQFEFRCAGNLAVDHPLSVRTRQMWNAIERESGGRVRAQFFPNSQLGGDAAMFEELRTGALQFYFASPGSISGVVFAAPICDVGFAFKNEEEALRVMDGRLGDYVRGEIAAKNLHALHRIWDAGMRQITAGTHPIRGADDLHGFKIRVAANRLTIDFFKTLGALPTPLSTSETYTALQTKLVDGEDMVLPSVEAFHYYEVQRYLSLTNHSWGSIWLIANGDVWKSLPADLQAVIERNNSRYAALEWRDMKVLSASTADKLARQGMAVNRVDSAVFRAQLRPFYTYWSGAFGPTVWDLLQSSISGKLG